MFKTYQNTVAMLCITFVLTGCQARIRGINIATKLYDLVTNCDSTTMAGSGTQADPHIICSPAQLSQVVTGNTLHYYALGRDIDVSSLSAPLGIFSAHLDGQGYALSSFKYSNSGVSEVGLFTTINDGEVKNLVIDSFKVDGYTYVGTLAGKVNMGTSRVQIANVTVKNSAVGGFQSVAALSGSFNSCDVSESSVLNSTVVSAYMGGLFGAEFNDAHVSKIVVQGYLSGSGYLGGLGGYSNASTFDQIAIYADLLMNQDGWYTANYGTQGYLAGFFGYSTQNIVNDIYFTGSIVSSATNSDSIGQYSGAAWNDQVTHAYFAAKTMADLGTATNKNGILGSDWGANAFSDSYYYAHANAFTNERSGTDVDDYVKADLEDLSNFGFDTNLWQLATDTDMKFPVLKFQTASNPFKGVHAATTSDASVVITNATEAMNGYDYAQTNSGTFAYANFTFTNNSSVPVYLTSLETAGLNDGAFLPASGVFAQDCYLYVNSPIPLYPAQHCTAGIRFDPQPKALTDVERDALIIGYTANGIGNKTVYQIDGAAQLMDPYIANGSSTIDWGDVLINTTTPQTITITNTGPADGTIVSIALTNGTEFTYDNMASTCHAGDPILSTASCDMVINFSATIEASYTDTLTVTYENAAHEQKTAVFSLAGNAWIVIPDPGRFFFTSNLMGNGKVLVAGGSIDQSSSKAILKTAKIFDPITETWTPTAPMRQGRSLHAGVTLNNGKVLVVGGWDIPNNIFFDSAEIFDPVTETWSDAAPMNAARGFPTATKLQDGRVLVAGGYVGASLASAEIYDPVADTWTLTANMSTPRRNHAGALLPDGRVLISAGFDSPWTSEIYDPVTDSWSAAANLNSPRHGHGSVTLPNGKVLVLGAAYSFGGGEIYDPVMNTWTTTANPTDTHFSPGLGNGAGDVSSITLLPDGRVAFVGGNAVTSTAEYYDYLTDTWSAPVALTTPRIRNTIVYMPSTSKLLVCGGDTGSEYAPGTVIPTDELLTP